MLLNLIISANDILIEIYKGARHICDDAIVDVIIMDHINSNVTQIMRHDVASSTTLIMLIVILSIILLLMIASLFLPSHMQKSLCDTLWCERDKIRYQSHSHVMKDETYKKRKGHKRLKQDDEDKLDEEDEEICVNLMDDKQRNDMDDMMVQKFASISINIEDEVDQQHPMPTSSSSFVLQNNAINKNRLSVFDCVINTQHWHPTSHEVQQRSHSLKVPRNKTPSTIVTCHHNAMRLSMLNDNSHKNAYQEQKKDVHHHPARQQLADFIVDHFHCQPCQPAFPLRCMSMLNVRHPRGISCCNVSTIDKDCKDISKRSSRLLYKQRAILLDDV